MTAESITAPTPDDVRVQLEFNHAVESSYGNPLKRIAIFDVSEIVREAHAGQERISGNGVFEEHLLGSALILLNGIEPPIRNTDIVTAVLLHDSLEDADYFVPRAGTLNSEFREAALERISEEFNPRVAEMVLAVTKPIIDGVEVNNPSEVQQGVLKNLEAASAEALVVKIADRLNNLRTISALPVDSQVRIAIATLRLYLPVFERAREEYPQVGPLLDEMRSICMEYVPEALRK